MGLHVLHWFESQLLVVNGVLGNGKLNVALIVKGLLVNVWESDFEAGDDLLFDVISQPAIIDQIDNFYLQSVEVVVYRNEEPLLEFEL